MTNKKREDRRIRRTRRLLQNALIELLRQKPLAKIQIKQIVEVADVSRPTFYQHFDTKEELLFSHMEDVFEKIYETVFSAVGENKTVDMLGLLTATYQQWHAHREALQWVIQVENKDLLISAIGMHISAIKKEFDKHAPPLESSYEYEEYIISFVSGGAYMLLKNWLANDMRESPEQMAALSATLLLNGFSPIHANGQ